MKIEKMEINVKNGTLQIKHPRLSRPAELKLKEDELSRIQQLKKVAEQIAKNKFVSLEQSKIEELLIKLSSPEPEPKAVTVDELLIQLEEETEEKPVATQQEIAVVPPTPQQAPKQVIETPRQDVKLPDWTDQLLDTQRQWLAKIAEINNMTQAEYIANLTKRVEASTLPTHEINILYQDAWKHGLVKLTKEKMRFVVFAVPSMNEEEPFSAFKCLVPSTVSVTLGDCYNIGDTGRSGRCIALSPPISPDHYSGWNLPTISKLEKVADMNNIPRPIDCYSPIYLIQALNMAKKNVKGLHECISATVQDVRNPREDLYYLEVNDGTLDKSVVVSVGPLFSDNPWNVKDIEIEQSKGKSILVYGFMIYEPPSKEGYREQLTVNPAFVMFA